MNKQLLHTVIIVLAVLLSVGAVSASDANVTDSTTSGLDALSVPVMDSSLSDGLNVDKVSSNGFESERSNYLSTNSDDSNSLDNSTGISEEPKINVSNTVVSKDLTKYYKGSAAHTATFYDEYGNPLVNTNVKFIIAGKTYTKKTNAKGVASLGISLKPGTYKIISQNPVTGYKLTNTIKVLTTINANDITKVYTDGRKFYATFLKNNGKALANKYIKFKVNGKTYSVKTNAKGVAGLSLTKLKVGTFKIISYNTDGLTRTNTVKVVSKTSSKLTTTSYTFLRSESKTIKVTLLNGLGYAPSAGKIVKIAINGKTYSAKTNANGVASLKLPTLKDGSYTVKYSFAGNKYYYASSASNKVLIIPSKVSKFTVKSTTTFTKGTSTQFKVALTSGNVPLAGKKVTITINGTSYDKTTDNKGLVSLPINLDIGKYPVSYKFAGESKINAASGLIDLEVKEKTSTNIGWNGETSFVQGAQSCKVLLQDANNKPVSGKVVKLTVYGMTYSATTDSNGYATFKIGFIPGNHTVSFSFEDAGDNDYAPCSGSVNVSVEKKEGQGYGYWVFGRDMKKVDLNELASKGTSDIFLNYYAVETHGNSTVESWIASANNLGIRVHIWVQTFYADNNWINPINDGVINQKFFDKKINEVISYAKLKGISGVHLDYLRYPGNAYKTVGGTKAISNFVQKVTSAIRSVNPNIIISCALMPEKDSNKYYYGQDYDVISKCMDVVIPMIYKGNYGKSSSWITTTTEWFVDHSNGAKVWSGLQGYVSDKNTAKLSAAAIKADSQAALDGKASGVIIFRWSMTNFVDFNSLTVPNFISISDIVDAANALKSSIDSTNTIPNTVTVGGVEYSTAQFLYMMSEAIKNINAGKLSSEISPKAVNNPTNPAADSFKPGDLKISDYVGVASRVSTFILNNGRASNYAVSPLGNIGYNSLVKMFSYILADYKVTGKLPSTVKRVVLL